MANIDYFGLLKKSLDDFLKNPILLMPILVGVVIGLGIFFVMAIEFFVLFLVSGAAIFTDPKLLLSIQGISLMIFFVLLDLILIILVRAYTTGMQIGMYKDIMLYQKTTIKNMFDYGKLYVMRYFKVVLILTAITLLPFMILAGISASAFLASMPAGIIASILSALIFFPYILFITIFLYFIDPIFVSQDKHAMEIIKSTFAYTKNNFTHVAITLGVSALTGLAVVIALFLVLLPLNGVIGFSQALGKAAPIAVLFKFMSQMVSTAVQVVLGIVIQLFIFNSYFTKNNLYKKKAIVKSSKR